MRHRHRASSAGRLAVALFAAALFAAVLSGPARGATPADEVADYFSGHWYYTEVVVFERPEVMDYLGEERLARPPAAWPRNLREFESATPLWREYPLYPAMRAFLSLPWLDQARLYDVAGEEAMQPAGSAPPPIAPRLGPDPLLDLLGRVGELERELAARSDRWLPEDTLTLSAAANRLRQRGGYRVLLHGRWLQNVPPRDTPQAFRVRGGAWQGTGFSLEGALAVTLGRYLHVRADLYYRQPLLGRAPVDRPMAPPQLAEGALAHAPLAVADLTPAGYLQLHQSRRLRSGELHYLDHPKLGMLVRVDPVEPPADLVALFEALEEGDE